MNNIFSMKEFLLESEGAKGNLLWFVECSETGDYDNDSGGTHAFSNEKAAKEFADTQTYFHAKSCFPYYMDSYRDRYDLDNWKEYEDAIEEFIKTDYNPTDGEGGPILTGPIDALADGSKQTVIDAMESSVQNFSRDSVKNLILIAGLNPMNFFESPRDLLDFFNGELDWLPENYKKAIDRMKRSNDLFGED